MNIQELTREKWLMETFPEWGTWLNEEIQAEKVPANKFVMWWLGGAGVWIKSPEGCNVTVDFWVGRGRTTHAEPPYEHRKDFQITRMTGGRTLPPFLRVSPVVIDPFAVTELDICLSTHFHDDHIDPFVAAAVCKNTNAVFAGPKFCVEKWLSWGVPKERLYVLKVGDVLEIKDVQIFALESFDRTALITPPPEGDIRGRPIPAMEERALNYLIKTPGGTIYHSGDSHYSNYYFKHGKNYQIDVVLLSYGINPPGSTDKMTACDCLRAAECLRAEVLIPYHYDLWSNQVADPRELEILYEINKHRYKFNLYIWKVGGKFVYPDDKGKRRYEYPSGGEDSFTDEPNIPFPTFL